MEGADWPPRSRRFAHGKPPASPLLRREPYRDTDLRGVRTLASVLNLVLAELGERKSP
jgi:hypothetical protein